MPLAHLERHERELYFRGYSDGRERYAAHGEASVLLMRCHSSISEHCFDEGCAAAYYHEGWVLGWQDARAALAAVRGAWSNVVDLDAWRQSQCS